MTDFSHSMNLRGFPPWRHSTRKGEAMSRRKPKAIPRKPKAIPRAAKPLYDPRKLPNEYFTRAKGDCMEPEIPHGSVIHCSKKATCKVGDLVVLFFRSEVFAPGQAPVCTTKAAGIRHAAHIYIPVAV
jgi:hypothetical protein